tara:strand:- start:50 stop:1093 length:1044 start_codon:yes stop_codon:yes gene_type:complete
MVKELLIDKHGLGHAVAVRENRKLKDLFIDPMSAGSFYPPYCFLVAKVSRRAKERGGYFIKLPNKKEGFLLSKKAYSQGQHIVAMAKIFNERDKLQRFSDKLKVETRYFIIEQGNGSIFFSKNFSDSKKKKDISIIIQEKINEIGENISVIVRSSVNNSEIKNLDDIFNLSLNSFKKLIDDLKKDGSISMGMLSKEKAINFYRFEENLQVIEKEGIFELQGVWDEIENLCKKKYLFGKNSYLIIEQTSAFCAIDVNSGSDLKIQAVKVNLDACNPIIYNIRLRGIGGKIIIDFLPCSLKEKNEIEKKIVSGLQAVRGDFTVSGWTKGNNFEIEGSRNQIPLNLIMES